jgi:signal transduction histidine kinase
VVTDDMVAVAAFLVVQGTAVAWLAMEAREIAQRWRLESRLARLVRLMSSGEDPQDLVASIREAAREPSLRLVFWAPQRQAWVDPDGRSTRAMPGPDERVTAFTREGHVVAAVVHPMRSNTQRLERALGPALLLALENGQLRAAALSELDELERSRSRVVERAALERRRLERNLHDDAQQRAMSLTLLVRMLEGRAGVAPDAVRRAERLTQLLTEELRRVARGIYPAALGDTGLAGAVLDLAERSDDLPVLVDELPDVRCPGAVETTAFLVISASVTDARRGGASEVRVTGAKEAAGLRVSVEDDASTAAIGVAELGDQVGALGGTLVVSGAPGRRRVEVVLPCES